jgi:hypothetical protein
LEQHWQERSISLWLAIATLALVWFNVGEDTTMTYGYHYDYYYYYYDSKTVVEARNHLVELDSNY